MIIGDESWSTERTDEWACRNNSHRCSSPLLYQSYYYRRACLSTVFCGAVVDKPRRTFFMASLRSSGVLSFHLALPPIRATCLMLVIFTDNLAHCAFLASMIGWGQGMATFPFCDKCNRVIWFCKGLGCKNLIVPHCHCSSLYLRTYYHWRWLLRNG